MTNIAENQNKDKNINKLKAQRQAYSEVKFLMIISLIIGVVVPCIVSFFTFFMNSNYFSSLIGFQKQDLGYFSALIGIVSTFFIELLSRIIFSNKEQAAKIQECFDTDVFDLDWDNVVVGSRPDIGIIAEKSSKFDRKNPNYTGFYDWYTPKAANYTYPHSIVLCQQQNLCWDNYLRKPLIYYSFLSCIGIILFIIILGTVNNTNFRDFLTNILSLLIPVILYFYKLIIEHKDSINENERLQTINEQMREDIRNNSSNDEIIARCRMMQSSIYSYRKNARPIPNWFHKKTKNKQENISNIRVEDFIES
ncbi:hypothetical protein B8W92_08420 [Moraxella osloensis]|uniref:Uncharacterized protein n=2 Tax=Gammaproteobacteria TaxID=1236 RepID=A0A270ARA7_FAUOS|nr:S-4TM family putative pore-forming effector [Moraxella osloensis]PAL15287.1 hypothetical protein B8W92_08420 [Moraxella osloensis]PKZ68902.1 hypothetical protein CYJ96_05380 [Moraxella osloensis]